MAELGPGLRREDKEGACPGHDRRPQGRARHLPPLGPYAVSKASLDMLVKIYAGEVVVASAVSSRPNV
jgi:dTDP-D-glucose 4,6-dehydratase